MLCWISPHIRTPLATGNKLRYFVSVLFSILKHLLNDIILISALSIVQIPSMPPRRRARSIPEQPSASSPPPPPPPTTTSVGPTPRATRSKRPQSSLTIDTPKQQLTTRAPLSAPSTGVKSWALPKTPTQLEPQRRSSRTTAVKAREIIREAVLPGSYTSSPTGRQRRSSINSANNSPASKNENSAYLESAVPSESPVSVSAAISAAIFEFTPKTKLSDMDGSGSINLQDEGKADEPAEATEEKSMSSTAVEISMVIEPIESQVVTDVTKATDGENLEQEADAGREKSKERQVAENLGNGEAMQVDNDQMQGGSHSLITKSADDKR